MIRSSAWTGKRYAILGLARSGMATLDALVASGAEVMAWDQRPELCDAVADRVMIGDPLVEDLSGLDGLIVSPGVPINNHPVAALAAEADVPVIGDIELFAQARPSLPPHRLVGITGTNGKSTTTALIRHICEEAGVPALMGGNIGLPILSQEPLQANENGPGVYVLELSSYQIDLTYSLDCDVAILLNVTPDHLDRYDSFVAYAAAKARLFDMMSADHIAIMASDDAMTSAAYQGLREEGRIRQVISTAGQAVAGQADWPALQGPHNAQNVAAAVAAVEALGIGEAEWRPALASFGGLPHRMERVAEHAGVLYVNDSKATNPASTAPALAAFERVHWIAGGLPKTESLDECAPWFDHVVQVYTIGEAGPLFERLLSPSLPVKQCEMMVQAVQEAAAYARAGDTVLLSPACASFDQFKDFEARGDCFRNCVEALVAKYGERTGA